MLYGVYCFVLHKPTKIKRLYRDGQYHALNRMLKQKYLAQRSPVLVKIFSHGQTTRHQQKYPGLYFQYIIRKNDKKTKQTKTYKQTKTKEIKKIEKS